MGDTTGLFANRSETTDGIRTLGGFGTGLGTALKMREVCLSDRYTGPYSSYSHRMKTFDLWPKSHPGPKPCDLAAAGFYYLEKGDITSCFFCHVQVSQWESTDGAIQEHYRYRPDCGYLKYLTNN